VKFKALGKVIRNSNCHKLRDCERPHQYRSNRYPQSILQSLVSGNQNISFLFSFLILILLGNSCLPTIGKADNTEIFYPIPQNSRDQSPFDLPDYEGVEQILILSDRWVIVVTNSMDELYKKINDLSEGKLTQSVESWFASKDSSRPNWKAYKSRWKIRDKFIAEARSLISESKTMLASSFNIHSEEDANYHIPKYPSRSDRLFVSAGHNRKHGGVFPIDYNIYSYLEMPTPMQEGAEYQIRLNLNEKSVSFKYDRKKTISRAIKINQLGYLPEAKRKIAYLGAYLYRFGPLDLSHVKTFEVINAETGQVALSGDLELLEKNPRFAPKNKDQNPKDRPLMYGEDVYAADFSGLKDEGYFFISVPGVGRSWPFRHASSVYGEAFYKSIRALFHQRGGMEITEKFSSWTRPKVKRGPYCESEHIYFPPHTDGPKGYERFDVIGATTDCSKTTNETAGGWHDAADWDSNLAHYTVIFDLLNAFAFNPENFIDGQLNLPESGNGIPDILDEAYFGLELWRISMDEQGGVSGMLETWTHTKMMDTNFNYAFSQRTRWSSLIFAAAAAQFSELVSIYNQKIGNTYREAAIKAYNYGIDSKNSLGKTIINAKKKRGKGQSYTFEWTETDEHVLPYLLHAKLRLYLLTGIREYLNGIAKLVKHSKEPYQWHFNRKDFSPWIYYSLLEASQALPKTIGWQWRKWFISDADKLLNYLDQSPYAVTWPRSKDYWLAWGASNMNNFNRSLFIAYKLSNDRRYVDAAIQNMDFMLGANPMGMSWTTGLGFVYPIDIQHEMSEIDGIFDPVPGITIYGITGGPIFHKFREQVWRSPGDKGEIDYVTDDTQRKPPLWRRWMVHPHLNVAQNEFTIQETMSSMIFTSSLLMSEGWSPTESLLQLKPRKKDDLFGRWYLP